ncbi:MAG: hypothetical protein WCO63_15190 [Bacteroidota bacterium]
MKGRFSEDELSFINEVLHKHGEYVKALLKADINTKRLIKSSDLRSSIKNKDSKYGDSPVLQLEFLGYGRAIEIAWHKKSLNTRSMLTGVSNRNRLGKKPIKQKNTRWYSKNVYGTLNNLISMLLYEYADHIRDAVKDNLEHIQ